VLFVLVLLSISVVKIEGRDRDKSRFPRSGDHLLFIPGTEAVPHSRGVSVDPVKSEAWPKIQEPRQLQESLPSSLVSEKKPVAR
jgi:hypothetical protein